MSKKTENSPVWLLQKKKTGEFFLKAKTKKVFEQKHNYLAIKSNRKFYVINCGLLKTRHTEGTNTKSYMKAMIRSKIQKSTKIETEGQDWTILYI